MGHHSARILREDVSRQRVLLFRAYSGRVHSGGANRRFTRERVRRAPAVASIAYGSGSRSCAHTYSQCVIRGRKHMQTVPSILPDVPGYRLIHLRCTSGHSWRHVCLVQCRFARPLPGILAEACDVRFWPVGLIRVRPRNGRPKDRFRCGYEAPSDRFEVDTGH